MERLSNNEEKILLIIWDSSEPIALPDIVARANTRFDKSWKPETVSTYLQRATRKGWLINRRQGRYYYYSPVVPKEVYRKEKLASLISEYYGGDTDTLIFELREVVK